MLPSSTKASDFSRQVRSPDFYKIHNLKIFICWQNFFQNSGWGGRSKQNQSVFQMWSLGHWFATSAEIFFLE